MKLKDDFLLSSGAEVSIIPVVSSDGGAIQQLSEKDKPSVLPILALRSAVIFPGAVFPITIGREKSKKLIHDVQKNNLTMGVVPQKDFSVEEPKLEDLYPYGTVVKILKYIEMPDGNLTVIIQAYNRIQLGNSIATEPYQVAEVTYLEDITPEIDDSVNIIADSLKEKATNILKASNFAPKEAIAALNSIDNFAFLVNFIATTIETEKMEDKITLLQYSDLKDRAMALLKILDNQNELLKIRQEINQKVKVELDQQQREFYLNSQLKTIQEELGMDSTEGIEEFKEKAKTKKWSKEVEEIFNKELSKLEKQNPHSPEYSTQYNYIQFILDLPWEEYSEDNLDLKNAQNILNEDHYGLDSVKDRILEYLAVLKLKANMKSPILCLYGPPGVGKTSLGKSVARALGRKYVRIALGGMHDEAEIRGHRKTYIGALAGRILNGIKKAGTSNPVIVLDEIDKLSTEFRGDPSSALLEALDPEQNTTFHDNYLDIDYDLSKVLFITTANNISTIQSALLDRMELIDISGYLAEEKFEIANKFLLPRQLEEHGIDKDQLTITEDCLSNIIDNYTRESGVRGLEKNIAKLVRKTAKKIAMEEKYPKKLEAKHLKEYLGLPTNYHSLQKGNEFPGVVTGLAWTSVGGEILFIETSLSKGKGQLTMTGNMGTVMKESTTIAYQYLKAHPELCEKTAEEFANYDLHLHVPEGATPKDGPSAGITMISSMVSAFRNKAVKKAIAMTGEMTLRGKVLPVGGIKEKILAAKRSGVNTIILSEENRKDIEDIKEIYIKGLKFVYVNDIQDVIKAIF